MDDEEYAFLEARDQLIRLKSIEKEMEDLVELDKFQVQKIRFHHDSLKQKEVQNKAASVIKISEPKKPQPIPEAKKSIFKTSVPAKNQNSKRVLVKPKVIAINSVKRKESDGENPKSPKKVAIQPSSAASSEQDPPKSSGLVSY